MFGISKLISIFIVLLIKRRRDMLTPNNLLSTGELKNLVEKHSTDELKPYFNNVFNRIEKLRIQGLRLVICCERANIQYMLDHITDEKTVQKFKEIYKD
jgi:hypothetical protein